jgi:hypothetical protein
LPIKPVSVELVFRAMAGGYGYAVTKRGAKTTKGRSRYPTDWKEPQLLIIYAVDEQGLRAKQFLPYLDGTMKGPDVL